MWWENKQGNRISQRMESSIYVNGPLTTENKNAAFQDNYTIYILQLHFIFA